MQSFSDSSIHFGWVEEISQPYIQLVSGGTREIENGCFHSFEVSGPHSMVKFVGQVIRCNFPTFTINLASNVTEQDLDTESRVRVSNDAGFILVGGRMFDFELADVSVNGLGGFTSLSLEPDTLVEVQINSKEGHITLIAVSRYSRRDRNNPGRVRVGFQISSMSRVGAARYRKLLNGPLTNCKSAAEF